MRRLHVFATNGKNGDRAKRGKCAVAWLGRIRLGGWSGIAAGLGQENGSEAAGRTAGFAERILSGLRATRAGLIRHGVKVKTALLEQAA
jgi:hypothetical protein